MTKRATGQRPMVTRRPALELLAGRPSGVTKKLLVIAHRFEVDTGLVRAAFATAERESLDAGGKTIEVIRITITEAGRRAIEG